MLRRARQAPFDVASRVRRPRRRQAALRRRARLPALARRRRRRGAGAARSATASRRSWSARWRATASRRSPARCAGSRSARPGHPHRRGLLERERSRRCCAPPGIDASSTTMVDGREVAGLGLDGKPAPDGFLEAARRLRCTPRARGRGRGRARRRRGRARRRLRPRDRRGAHASRPPTCTPRVPTWSSTTSRSWWHEPARRCARDGWRIRGRPARLPPTSRSSRSATATSACAARPRRARPRTTPASSSTASTRPGRSSIPRTPTGSPAPGRRSSRRPTARSCACSSTASRSTSRPRGSLRRVLDMRAGVLRREVELETASGARLLVRSRRLASLVRPQPRRDRLRGDRARRRGRGHGLVRAASPRGGRGRRRPAPRQGLRRATAAIPWRPRRSARACVLSSPLAGGLDARVRDAQRFSGAASVETPAEGDAARVVAEAALTAGGSRCGCEVRRLPLGRRGGGARDLRARVHRTLDRAARRGLRRDRGAHAARVGEFWARSDIEVEGAPEVQRAVRFNLFQLMQATARAEGLGVPAKGVTGRGYEGHYFWDTEIYVVPFLTHTNPEWAKPCSSCALRHAPRRPQAGARGRPRGRAVPMAHDQRRGGLRLVRRRHRAVPHQRRHRLCAAPLQPRLGRPRLPARRRAPRCSWRPRASGWSSASSPSAATGSSASTRSRARTSTRPWSTTTRTRT